MSLKVISVISIFVVFTIVLGCSDTNTNSETKSESDEVSELKIDQALTAKGDSIATLATQILGGKLKSAMAEGGVPHALEFCSANALTITDSISRLGDFEISRVALKNRNPKNSLNQQELEIFEKVNAHTNGESVSGTLIKDSEDMIYYKPIFVKGLCLACHGSKEQIGEENLKIITDLYPNDKATGYEINDLRGFWKIKNVKSWQVFKN